MEKKTPEIGCLQRGRFSISCADCVSMECITERNDIKLSVRRAMLQFAVSEQAICCSCHDHQCVCMLPASRAGNTVRLRVLLGLESIWDGGIILATQSWLLSFSWASLPLPSQGWMCTCHMMRSQGWALAAFRALHLACSSRIRGDRVTQNYPGEVNAA